MSRSPLISHLSALLATILLALTGCGGGGGTTPPPGGFVPQPAGQALGGGTLSPDGGTLDLTMVDIAAAPGALVGDVQFTAETAALPAPLPSGVVLAGTPIEITPVVGADLLDAPVTLTFTPDGLTWGAGRLPTIAHYDADSNSYEGATIIGFDQAAGTVTVESRAFSTFVPIEGIYELLPEAYSIPGFAPLQQGWSIGNQGDPYFTSGGNCLGMSAYCAWFFEFKQPQQLYSKYTGQTAKLLAIRAHLASSQKWAIMQHDATRAELTEVRMGQYEKLYLVVFEKPLVQAMTAPRGHASVVYGYNVAGFKLYEVNDPGGSSAIIPWTDADGFGTYSNFTEFSFLTKPSLGRNVDFRTLYDDAERGFRGADVVITEPNGLDDITTRTVHVKGTVNEPTWDQVSIFAAGRRFDGAITGSAFDIEVPLKHGETELTVLAGVDLDSQTTAAPSTGVASVTVNCTAETRAMLATLSWFENQSDVDLYMIAPDGQAIWYGVSHIEGVGTLDQDNTNGKGPEHITVGSTLQDGNYRLRVHYYADRDGNEDAVQPVSGKVNVLLHEDDPTKRREAIVWFNIPVDNSDNDDPTDSGPDWFEIGTVNFTTDTFTPAN